MTWRALAAALMALLCGTASAAEFYQGKQVTIVVGFSSGGTYDATARLFARHLGKYLLGKPTVIVRNMQGAGSLIAAKSLHSSLPKDGTTLGVVGGGVVLEPLLGNPQATYDPRGFNWIGGRTRDNFLCLVWHTVPVQTLQDVIKRETVVGATGPGSRGSKAIAVGHSAVSRPEHRNGSATARSGRSRSSRWGKRQFCALCTQSAASNHGPSSVDFIINMSGFDLR